MIRLRDILSSTAKSDNDHARAVRDIAKAQIVTGGKGSGLALTHQSPSESPGGEAEVGRLTAELTRLRAETGALLAGFISLVAVLAITNVRT